MKVTGRRCALFLISLASAAQASTITQLFTVTLPSATGAYGAGHALQISATYDNAGTTMNIWHDGPNGIAQFGGADDTVNQTFDLANYPGYTQFSDAQQAISGLAPLPLGTVPYDASSTNFAWYYTVGSGYRGTGYTYLQVQADSLIYYLALFSPAEWGNGTGETCFLVHQAYFHRVLGRGYQEGDFCAPGFSSVTITGGAIAEPATLALLGMGLVGLCFSRRRMPGAIFGFARSTT